ncbi:hypothetical protein EYF80_049169 [Liparis tanakae]|uniref:Uncharacterized protein n=1 Tax=Liparis tanakae TaxID=230148 RepID=A0A4Z2FIP9_9TELE|nr:hypothetical protein EYF80_049169 [Liparis tanakae]
MCRHGRSVSSLESHNEWLRPSCDSEQQVLGESSQDVTFEDEFDDLEVPRGNDAFLGTEGETAAVGGVRARQPERGINQPAVLKIHLDKKKDPLIEHPGFMEDSVANDHVPHVIACVAEMERSGQQREAVDRRGVGLTLNQQPLTLTLQLLGQGHRAEGHGADAGQGDVGPAQPDRVGLKADLQLLTGSRQSDAHIFAWAGDTEECLSYF